MKGKAYFCAMVLAIWPGTFNPVPGLIMKAVVMMQRRQGWLVSD
jgi:hypothetical protein